MKRALDSRFYIFFCLIGLLNVVTGIFVDSAVCTRTEDEVVESYTEEQGRLCKEMKRIFADADYVPGLGFVYVVYLYMLSCPVSTPPPPWYGPGGGPDPEARPGKKLSSEVNITLHKA